MEAIRGWGKKRKKKLNLREQSLEVAEEEKKRDEYAKSRELT